MARQYFGPTLFMLIKFYFWDPPLPTLVPNNLDKRGGVAEMVALEQLQKASMYRRAEEFHTMDLKLGKKRKSPHKMQR